MDASRGRTAHSAFAPVRTNATADHSGKRKQSKIKFKKELFFGAVEQVEVCVLSTIIPILNKRSQK